MERGSQLRTEMTQVQTLLKRADKASEEPNAMMIQPQSKQEKMASNCAPLIQFKPELSFDFTIDCQRLIHTNVTRSEQIPSPSSGV